MNDYLIVSETFYSIQGEGPSVGTPAVFLRLAGCNLRCNGFSYRVKDTNEHLGCDSKQVWMRGEKTNFNEIIHYWEKRTWLEKLLAGAHLVITGGEPVIQQNALIKFIHELDHYCQKKIYLEIETNGTRFIQQDLLQRLNQINVSPKLKHSGEPKTKAYQPQVLAGLALLPKSKFKFVVARKTDAQEILQDYLEPFALKAQQIWLMAEGATREAIQAKAPWIVELCKAHNFHYTPRLQVDIWDEVTGV